MHTRRRVEDRAIDGARSDQLAARATPRGSADKLRSPPRHTLQGGKELGVIRGVDRRGGAGDLPTPPLAPNARRAAKGVHAQSGVIRHDVEPTTQREKMAGLREGILLEGLMQFDGLLDRRFLDSRL